MGTHTITSKLKAHWATDSKPEPMGGALSGGSTFVTILANDLEYASYVDQGHRMDRHFVPGLYINDHSDRLEFDAEYGEAGGGLVVGTKTKYVKGEFMVDKAKEAYEKACLELLDEELERLLQ